MSSKPTRETLIMIPDISGFSNFVNEVAIDHSEHIIRELLDIIIKNNHLGLTVSEIEGDAVLFYKYDSTDSLNEVLSMIEKMFIQFHEHLMLYQQNRICECGACQMASDLTLKVVIEQGETKEMHLAGRVKLVGPAMISAHLLLKNSIPSSEYILLSEGIAAHQNITAAQHPEWVKWETGEDIDQTGRTLKYLYTPLSPLRDALKPPPIEKRKHVGRIPILVKGRAAVNYRKAYNYLTDSSHKEDWMGVKGLKVIRENPDERERVGSKHICVINNKNYEFEVTHLNLDDRRFEMAEVFQNPGFMKDIILVYRCEYVDDQSCDVTFEMHFNSFFLLRPFTFIIAYVFKKEMKKMMACLTGLLERYQVTEQ